MAFWEQTSKWNIIFSSFLFSFLFFLSLSLSLLCVPKKIKIKILKPFCLVFERQSWIDMRKDTQREVFSIYWSTHQRTTMAWGAQSFFRVSHMGSRGPSTWDIFCCFPKFIDKELNWKWRTRSETGAHIDTGVTGSGFTCYTTMLVQKQFFKLAAIIFFI